MKTKKHKLWHIIPLTGIISLLISLIVIPPDFEEFLAIFFTLFPMLLMIAFYFFLLLVSSGAIKSDDVKFVKRR